ncbi:MAG: 3-oxoacyl-[acyl-carrier protein] reductase [Gammaproteobacteria bacterium]|jgi:3-oxoacyl-[acyl-carrier protein] reductase
MNTHLKGKVALITGAARGLGLAVSEDLARAGVNVCGSDIRLEALDDEFTRIANEFKVETLAVKADVGREADVKDLIKQVFSKWGKIDILINNAGIRRVGPVQDLSVETWDAIQDANLKGQFLCTREVLKQGMLEQNEGVIIFLSSDAGKHGQKNNSAYAVSKWGVNGFAESMAKELKQTKIRVTTIAPGRIWTPMAEESEAAEMDLDWLDAKDVSRAILFCIDQDADIIIPELRIYPRSQI